MIVNSPVWREMFTNFNRNHNFSFKSKGYGKQAGQQHLVYTIAILRMMKRTHSFVT